MKLITLAEIKVRIGDMGSFQSILITDNYLLLTADLSKITNNFTFLYFF